jgi:microcystin-dependent protein
MAETDFTTNRHLPYPTGKDLIPEGPAEMQAIATALDAENRGEVDFLQAGVVQATDWSFTAKLENTATCALESTATTGGVAWLPLTAIGLVRSVTTAAKLKALKPASLPSPSKYMTVGFELTPSTSGAAATVSVVSGAEQTTQALAEAHSPAITAGKARIRDIVILNTAGVYSIASQTERRSQCDLTHRPGDLVFSAAASRFGCLPAEAGSYPRASYPALFAEIGTAFGETAGDGLHFNVPDFRERVPMGAGKGAGGEEAEAFPGRTLGQKVGALFHKLTTGQLPSHTHTVNDPGHGHNMESSDAGGEPPSIVEGKVLGATTGGGANKAIANNYGGAFSFLFGVEAGKTGITNAATGSSETHNIVQPSTVCTVWIKY